MIHESDFEGSPMKKINDSLLITDEDLNSSFKSKSKMDSVNGFSGPTTSTGTETEEDKYD